MRSILFLIFSFPFVLSSQATVKEELRTLKTYPFSDPNPIPVLAKNAKIYPYHTFNGYSNEPIQKEWKVITLENEYIKVFVLPEIGGKVWGAIDKVNGEEFIYRNEVIKFRNISMRGPWTSGGIEFNFGIIGHHPSTATPVDYAVNTHDDGSVSCTVGNIDLPSHTQWRVTIRLPKDKSYFETNVNWYNPSPLHQAYYNWMTAAAFAQDDLVFHTPGDQYLKHSGEAKSWPIDSDNRNINAYKENNFEGSKSYHVVGEYNDFFGGYFENDDYGFGHWSEYEEIPGQKLWIWALSRSGGIWEDLLTDTDGQYIEFQAGREFLQYSPGEHNNPMTQAVFAPLSQDTWSEKWFPVRDIDGLTDVSEQGVMHVEQNNGKLIIGLNVFEKSKGTLVIRSGGEVKIEEAISLDVPESFIKEYELGLLDDFEVEIIELGLSYTTDKSSIQIKRPFESKSLLDNDSDEKNYYLGWEAYKFREYDKAQAYFDDCLKENPLHQEARSCLAELYFRNNEIDKSLKHVDTLLRIDTRNPHGNFIAGLSYMSKGDDVNALESLGWAARSIEFRSAAYTQMSKIYLKENEYLQAIKYANKALVFNAENISALQVSAIANRLLGNKVIADQSLKNILAADPLNHFANYEEYLHTKTDEALKAALNSHRSELKYQTILELVVDYVNLGRSDEALSLLTNSGEKHPLLLIWQAHLDKQNSKSYVNEINQLSPEFVFPYRAETLGALSDLSAKYSSWKLQYFKAMNHWALGDKKQATRIFESLGDKPDNAYFYAARKEIMQANKDYISDEDLDKALKLDKSALNYHNSSLQAYESKFYQRAKSISTEGMKNHPGNYMIEVDAAKAMMQTGDLADALLILEKVNLLPYEGASEGKQIYELVNNALALEKIELGNYKGAIENLNKAKDWPENLGVGKPFDPNEIFQNYLLSKVYSKTGDNSKGKKYAEEVIKYFDQNENLNDPRVALVHNLLSSSNKERAKELMGKVENEDIMKLLKSKEIDSEKSSTLMKHVIKALKLL